VIGETQHCYIGSVGGRGGEGGLRVRYEKQYVNRAKAIFGMDRPQGQPAFAAIFNDDEVAVDQIEPLERQIQQLFLNDVGPDAALFTPPGQAPHFDLIHEGNMPAFLQ